MRRWWEELVIDFFDRIDGLVAAAHRGRLDDEEHELAVQLAMIRFAQNLVHTFDGRSIGQLVNATKTLARYACIDIQRRSIAQRGPVDASLDEGRQADAHEPPAASRWQYEAASHAFAADEGRRDLREFLDWALPRVPETQRRVLQMSFDGVELEAICAELGISEANAYQRRSRGMKCLGRLREQWDG